MEHARWAVQFVWFISHQILLAPPSDRELIVRDLAFQWPIEMFQQLVRAVVDVADASVVHVEDSCCFCKLLGFKVSSLERP